METNGSIGQGALTGQYPSQYIQSDFNSITRNFGNNTTTS
jgi:hypothetical protein